MTKQPLYIGITGLKGAGKSTIADMLSDEIVGRVSIISLADPIKEVAQRICGFSDESMWGPSELREVPQRVGRCGELTPRFVLQQIGEQLRQHVHADIWVNALEEYIARLPIQPEVIVLPDVRYENEAVWLMREKRGYAIVLEPRDRHGPPSCVHPSERGLFGWFQLQRDQSRIFTLAAKHEASTFEEREKEVAAIWECIEAAENASQAPVEKASHTECSSNTTSRSPSVLPDILESLPQSC